MAIEVLISDVVSSGRALVHAIESVIIEWTHQIRDVLKKDSAQPLLEGLNPNMSLKKRVKPRFREKLQAGTR